MTNLCFIDLETDGLLKEVSVIWCAVAYVEDEQRYEIYPSEKHSSVESWLESIDGCTLVAHNGVSFDYKVLAKLHNFKYDLKDVLDTHILSRLYNPDREGGHSLASWGFRLGFSKGEYNDWSKFTPEMLEYCKRDVDVLRRLWFRLKEEAGDWDWSESIKLENHVWDIIAEQEQYGVLFDAPKAEELLSKVEVEIADIEAKVLAEVPRKAVQIGASVMKPFKKDGSLSKVATEWMNTL